MNLERMPDLHQLRFDLREAAGDIVQKPFASFLSALGVAIGVAALMAMLSIGEGARQVAMRQVVSLGMNTIRLEDGLESALEKDRRLANISRGLVTADIEHLSDWLRERAEIAWYYRRDEVTAFSPQGQFQVTAFGASANWPVLEGLAVSSGRLLTRVDSDGARRCLAGSEVAAALHLATGDTLRLDNELCTVIGLLAPRGALLTEGTGLSSLNFDRSVILHETAFDGLRSGDTVQGAVVQLVTTDEAEILATADEIARHMTQRHRGVLDVRVVVPVTLLQEARATQRLFSAVMGAIAGLTLLVGGVGILNIMLANISEQTRDIALRRAVGADASRILSLYLGHACLLTLLGSAAGIVLGVVLSLAVQTAAGWPVAFSWTALFVGPCFALLTGLLFGYYPARRASRLDVASALREA